MKEDTILEVKNLEISFSQYEEYEKGKTKIRNPNGYGEEIRILKVINGLDFELREGEIHAVVGASGSGKSLLTHAILGILPQNAILRGAIAYRGRILTPERAEKLRGRELVLIPQSVNYLDPLLTVEKQIGISMKGTKREKKQWIAKLLKHYGLESEVAGYYPFQLSGGMARKVLLATALTTEAKVIIADEPTPGLDEASLQEVLSDFETMRKKGSAILMITHDILAAIQIADRITIFYAGTSLETALATDFKDGGKGLRHPYTKALYHALPENGFVAEAGNQPMPDELPQGCIYMEQCSRCKEECRKSIPIYREIRGGKVRCIDAVESS